MVGQCKFTTDNINIFQHYMAIFLYNNLGHFIMRDPVIKLRLHFVAGIGLRACTIVLVC